MAILDYEKLEDQAKRLHEQYAGASPFPHAVIDGFLPEDVADAVRSEFSDLDDVWKFYHHYNEKKLAITDPERMPPPVAALLAEFETPRFVDFIQKLTGLDGLIPDPNLEGAGMHMIRRGGFLNIHNDFQTHTKNRTWSRQVNLILYLNRDWREEWGGHAELWNADMTRREHALLPVFNRCLIFNTQAPAHHGHPDPLTCPEDQARKSIAVYYYRDEGAIGKLAPTDYQARPDDTRMKRLLIRLDEVALRVVTFLKGHTPLSDETLSRILKRFG